MLIFDPQNPFPHLSLESVAYADQQAHAAHVDEWLGLQTFRVEAAIMKNFDHEGARARDERHWIGLPVQSLLTPYTELRFILEKLRPETESIVDLGSGYGRMGFVIAKHLPTVRFLGIEVVDERVREGSTALQRFISTLVEKPSKVELIKGDLSAPDFEYPNADVYFLYDYGSASAIEKTLRDLQTMARRRPITVVGRGGATRDAIEKRHAWLSGVQTPKHFAHFSIYRS